MYGLTLQTAATSEPVTLGEVKRQVSIAQDITGYDSLLTSYITAAREYVERYCNRQLVTATWDFQFDAFPCGLDPINIPRAPLSSVTSITYLAAADGASTTWTSSEYRVITSTEPGKIVPAYNYFYPSTRAIAGAVTVRFVAGAAVASVPVGIKQAILLLVSNWFDNRGPVAVGTISTQIQFTVEILLESYRVADDFIRYEREPELSYAE